jgi:hypothetical protein
MRRDAMSGMKVVLALRNGLNHSEVRLAPKLIKPTSRAWAEYLAKHSTQLNTTDDSGGLLSLTGATKKNSKDKKWAEKTSRKYSVASCIMVSKMLEADGNPIILNLHAVNAMITNTRTSMVSRREETPKVGNGNHGVLG